jgi:hypothetical protein
MECLCCASPTDVQVDSYWFRMPLTNHKSVNKWIWGPSPINTPDKLLLSYCWVSGQGGFPLTGLHAYICPLHRIEASVFSKYATSRSHCVR